ncbi:MAG: hypothetical protein WC781_04230 [Candidatus Pacearchaeota archaeon]
MKFNFRKISSVLACTAMLGSTIGIAAAAAYPAPFVSGGVSDAAIVVGSSATSDLAAATDIGASLTAALTSQAGAAGGVTLGGTGDKVQLAKSSVKINVGDTITGVWGTSITKSDLPTLLADETFRNKQNDEYKYTQKIDLGALQFTHFSDSDYNNKIPTLGFKIAANTFVANYTINFNTKPEATQGTDLTDFENKNIKILGKNYYILDFKNSTAKMTLLDSADSTSITEGETKTVTVGTNTYNVAINFIGADQVILTVNGENTEKLSATGTTYGSTYKLNDGTYVGIKSINVNDYAGGNKNVEFSLGKGKLEITDSSNVKLNDKNIDDVYGYITLSYSGSKRTLDKIVLKWTSSDKTFLTPGKELIMPGFEAFKFVMEDTTMPLKENTYVRYSGDDVLEMKTTIKDGEFTLPLLYWSTTSGNISGIGKASDTKLVTSNTTTLIFNATSGADDGFIVSWANARDSESYYLKASTSTDSTTGINKTTIKNKITSEDLCNDYYPSGPNSCTIGNVVLTIQQVLHTAGADRTVNMTVNSGGSFHELYTKDGLKAYLPFAAYNTTTGGTKGAINYSGSELPTTIKADVAKFVLWFAEKDRNGDLDKVAFNVTATTSGTTTRRITISDANLNATFYETSSGSKMWEAYDATELASKITWDKTNSDQYSATVENHGGEVFANVFIAAPSVTSSASGSTILTIKDSEVSSASGKNLIVVGGSCVNTVAATLLGSSAPLCGSDFTAVTGVGTGEFLIQTFSYGTGKVATLVAGYEAADTKNAATALTTKTPDTTVGKKYKGTTANTITESA